MEITGKFVELLIPKTGQSTKGNWKKQDFIIETEEQFPKKICISNWSDKVDLSSLHAGDAVKVSVNIESREYNGNWFTDIKVWKLESTPLSAKPAEDLPGLTPDEPMMPWQPESDSGDQDLPF